MQSAVDAESTDLPDFITKHVGLPGDIQRYNFSKNKHWVSVTILQSFSSILPSYMYGAFKEGWGLYSEYLGYDLGIYQNEPLKELGYIKGMV